MKILITKAKDAEPVPKAAPPPPAPAPPPPAPPPPPPAPPPPALFQKRKPLQLKSRRDMKNGVEVTITKDQGAPTIDLMNQLQNRLKKRQNRNSLALKYADLK